MDNRDSAPESAPTDRRAAPDDQFVAAVRQRFPVEREIDRVLSRKMAHRAGPGYTAIPLANIIAGTNALIQSKIGNDFTLAKARWLQGGASKLQVAFDIEWNGPDSGVRRTTPMVLRMEPPEGIVETSRRREFEILKLMQGVVPVPPCYWIDAEGEYLPHPALIYGFAPGVTKPKARPAQQVTGIGTNFGPELRAVLAGQFVTDLAAIHTVAGDRLATLTSFEPAEIGSNASVVRQVNWWRRVWEEDRPEDIPLVDVAARWLISHAPPLDHVSVVHGDFRAGNFLFSEEEQRITAWLDWELAVLGDRHQDLTWATGAHFGHYAEDGHSFLACGLLPAEELFRRYQTVSGLPVDPNRLIYYRVFNDFMSTVHMLATAWRVSNHGKTHQDVVVAWLSMIGNVIVGKLRDTLQEVL
jgi:aminoglycoside phosphotransferase (APT) family kinase protein